MTVYVHIPFCRSHCTYCGFYSEIVHRDGACAIDIFTDALCREISLADVSGKQGGDTLYFGGGTPSLLSAGNLDRICGALRNAGIWPDGGWEEFTFEANPDDIVRGGREYAETLLKKGVNRISVGIQSFDDTVLRRMGRRHNARQAVSAYRLLKESGFGNVSTDFIFGFASCGEKYASELERGLESLGSLPEHISCYQLAVEDGSGLEKMLAAGRFRLPDEDDCAAQYASICSLLASLGYVHYEISNWALPGYRARHNSSYWNHTPYLGFGPGAHSLSVKAEADGFSYTRHWNRPDLKTYISAARKGDFESTRESETLSEEQYRAECIMLGLRTRDGIPAALAGAKADGRLVPVSDDAPAGNLRIAENEWFIADAIIARIF